MSVDYSRGYTASFHACFVNPSTWADDDWFEIVSGSINRTCDSLRNSASLTVRDYDEVADKWIRIYMDTSQNGGKDREALFTGLATSPGRSYKDGVYDVSIDCYSVLKALEDILLPRGYYVVGGENGVRRIVDLLSAIPARVPITYQTDAFTNSDAILKYSLVAEDNETYLSMVEKILGAINWRMQVFGDGTVYISSWNDAKRDGPIIRFASYENSVIETSFNIRQDLFNCPNVFQAIYGDVTATAKDEDENSILSIPNRGREIWMVEDVQVLEENESIGDYALRRLKEEQAKGREIDYSRRYIPGVYPDDIIALDYEEFYGTFYIDSQTITLGHAAVTSEQLSEVV